MTINIQRILCPVDFSESSDHACRYAVAFADNFKAELSLLHVVSPPIAALPGDHLAPDMMQADIDAIADASRTRLEEQAQELGAKISPQVKSTVLSGIPFLEIIRYGKEWNADLIIMGTHGRAGLQHLLIGSVAERVVRKAPCPVLTVKHPQHEFVMP